MIEPICQLCGGAWLHNYVFAHVATCQSQSVEDDTLHSDIMRLRNGGYKPFERQANTAEINAYFMLADWKPPEGFEYGDTDTPVAKVWAITPNIRARSINGHTPEERNSK